MNIVYKLIQYRTERNAEVLGDIPPVNPDSLIVIATEILSWLRRERKHELLIEQGKSVFFRPLELNMKYPWCNDLEYLLSCNNCLSEVFCINNMCLDFKEDISMDYIRESRKDAYENYNPKMIIS